MKNMTSKQFFNKSEKLCLLELIVKHSLNKTTLGLTTNQQAQQKLKWFQLTEEFNCIETNSKRTENQLKKCWDNLKSRRKAFLTKGKQDRMSTEDNSGTPDTKPVVAKNKGPKQFFSYAEKMCLQELVLKHHLHEKDLENPHSRKVRWVQLTEEFNSIETNSKRTEMQLKKLWDNLRIRKKSFLSKVKREKMSGEEESFSAEEEPVSQESIIPDVLEQADTKPCGGLDSGSAERSSSEESDSESETSDQPPPHRIEEVDTSIASFQRDKKNTRSRRQGNKYASSRRRGKKEMNAERDAQIRKLVKAEKQWLVKAAEETFKRAKVEREAAEELLLYNRAKRLLAESELYGNN